jgi:DNA polymerase-1
MPALDRLLKACKRQKQVGWIRALDGRILACKTEHGALNDLLQSDGAIAMKHALVLFHKHMGPERIDVTTSYMLNVHDEIQLECEPSHAEAVARLAVECIRMAGVER